MRVHRFAKLVTVTIKLKEARKVIRKWYVYCNFKRHLLVLHNLSFSAIGGVPVPIQGKGVPILGGPKLGGVPAGGSQFRGGPKFRGVPIPGGSQSQLGGSQFRGGPSPLVGGSQSELGGPNSRGGPSQGGPNSGGGSQPCDLSQHAILILPLWCPSCK